MTGVGETLPVGTMSTAPQVLLAHHLKQLKLPTVLREYERVARERPGRHRSSALPAAVDRA